MKKLFQKKTQWTDYYTKQAKKNKYPSRSIYKLKEIQEKYKLFKKGNQILDLGSAPGSWLLYTAKIVGTKGNIVGIDLNSIKMQLPKNVIFFKNDVVNFKEILTPPAKMKFHSVISDMAPATTGNNIVDETRSLNLSITALKIADIALIQGGSFICKIFHGENLKKFSKSVKKRFKKQFLFKPKSTRKGSKEIYVLGLDKS